MKGLLTCCCLAALAAADPNRLPQEDARAFARPCVERAAELTDLPLKVDADAEKPCAVRGEGGGAMVIPDKGLTADRLKKAGKEAVPVAQLWLRKWTPVRDGKPVADDQLRIVTVRLDDKDRPMPLLLLGVRAKGDKGELELLVYSRESEPLLVLPLKAVEAGEELPVELEWQRGDKDADSLTITLLGKRQAILKITRQGK
jgi:hypothetical protein